MRTKTFSLSTNKGFRVTKKDLSEFNYWIKSRFDGTPRLREKFKTDREYEDFMIDYQENLDSSSNEDKLFDKFAKLQYNRFTEEARSKFGSFEKYKTALEKGKNSNPIWREFQESYKDKPF